jgi:hypothetical protein
VNGPRRPNRSDWDHARLHRRQSGVATPTITTRVSRTWLNDAHDLAARAVDQTRFSPQILSMTSAPTIYSCEPSRIVPSLPLSRSSVCNQTYQCQRTLRIPPLHHPGALPHSENHRSSSRRSLEATQRLAALRGHIQLFVADSRFAAVAAAKVASGFKLEL